MTSGDILLKFDLVRSGPDPGIPEGQPRDRRMRYRRRLSVSLAHLTARATLDREDVCLYNGAVRVDWDPVKAKANLLAQGVSFAEAVSVLEDECALTREDSDSQGEQRFVTLGLSNIGNLLVVVYTYRESDIIRIISAWKANKRQRVQYEKTRC